MRSTSDSRGKTRNNDKTVTRLRELRDELLAGYERCRADLFSVAGADSDDEDATEQAWASGTGILRHLQAEIREVDDALERVRIGQYGRCVDCAAPIRADRLRAVPTARRCISCQAGAERKAG
ncbi:MAG TPA: TraR/DksA family transcriptional regulator [Phycisphaerae bacterium]|nr:TraR/DksA family transcriptional regulator [Phycisphaerae bacterium]